MKTATLLQKPVTMLSDLDPEGSYTYSDYLLWQFAERVELIRGKLFRMSPAPNLAHHTAVTALTRQTANFFLFHTCRVFTAPFDVRLPLKIKNHQDTTVVQPDLCVICDTGKLDEHGCVGAPDLVVEVLSPGNSKKEMREKFNVYEEAGVREYWIVNPFERHVITYVLNESGKFIGLAPVTDDDQLRSYIFPELVIELKEVFS